MFRLIAIALVATFSLLGLFGADSGTQAARTAATMGGLGRTGFAALPKDAPADDALPGDRALRYVRAGSAHLRTYPLPESEILGVLPRGTPVLLLDSDARGYARVEDDAGRVGYLPGNLLASSAPL